MTSTLTVRQARAGMLHAALLAHPDARTLSTAQQLFPCWGNLTLGTAITDLVAAGVLADDTAGAWTVRQPR